MCGCFRSFQLHHCFFHNNGELRQNGCKVWHNPHCSHSSELFCCSRWGVLLSQQVIWLLGANSNKASFNTFTLKYETKRCGTAPVQVEVKLFEVKQSSANMPLLQTWPAFWKHSSNVCSVISAGSSTGDLRRRSTSDAITHGREQPWAEDFWPLRELGRGSEKWLREIRSRANPTAEILWQLI